jgi:hypothetical protein
VLESWLADLQVEAAARSRARAAWLQRQAREEATFVGVLADLAERERALVVDTIPGRRHQGFVRVVGQDFVGLRTQRGTDVLVRYAAIASVRQAPREQGSAGDRVIAPVATFHHGLTALGGTGARVVAHSLGGSALQGELRSVGRDLLVLRLDGCGIAYVPLASLGEVSVVESG